MRSESRRPLVRVAALGLALWPGGGGCWLGEDRPRAGGSEPAPRPPWVLVIGQGGGFTGGGSGHSVRSDGAVHSWSQVTPGAERMLKAVGQAAPEALRALEQAMAAPGLVALKHREAGNVTGFLEWRRGDDVRDYSWTEGAGAGALPGPLQRARDAATAAVESARP